MYRPVPSYTDTSHFRAPWENVVLSGVGQIERPRAYGEVPAYTDIAHFRAPFKASMMSLGQPIFGMQPMTAYLLLGGIVVGLILFAD